MTSWTEELTRARLHVVSGKGGTGKTTIAAALALALATGGRRVLLIEVEGRQGIAQLFDRAPLPYSEERIASAPGGGEIHALAIDAEAALLEYLAMFYNLGFAGRTLRKMGAIEFATTLAPGLRDVLLTGKVKECVSRTGISSSSATRCTAVSPECSSLTTPSLCPLIGPTFARSAMAFVTSRNLTTRPVGGASSTTAS